MFFCRKNKDLLNVQKFNLEEKIFDTLENAFGI